MPPTSQDTPPATDPQAHAHIFEALLSIERRLAALEATRNLSWYDVGRILAAVVLGVLAVLQM